MALIPIKQFAQKYFSDSNDPVQKTYTLIKNNKHLKKKIKGLGTLVDETKYLKMVG